jgi:hypothetical protein
MTEPLEVTEKQKAAVDRVARFVVRMGLTVPAVLTLESMRPLSFVGSQFMHVLSPSITAMLSIDEWDELARLLEDRRGLDYVLERIETIDRERSAT